MVATAPHNHTHFQTITDAQVLKEVREVLNDDWDVVEIKEECETGFWPFKKTKTRTFYRLYYYIGIGVFDWQVMMCVSNRRTLMAFLAGYSAAAQDKAPKDEANSLDAKPLDFKPNGLGNGGTIAVCAFGQYAIFDDEDPRWGFSGPWDSGYRYFYTKDVEEAKRGVAEHYTNLVRNLMDNNQTAKDR